MILEPELTGRCAAGLGGGAAPPGFPLPRSRVPLPLGRPLAFSAALAWPVRELGTAGLLVTC